MFKTPKSKWLALGIIVLFTLNLAAIYFVNQSLENSKLLAHASDGMKQTFVEQQAFSDVFWSVVKTLDILALVTLVVFLIKSRTRKLKS